MTGPGRHDRTDAGRRRFRPNPAWIVFAAIVLVVVVVLGIVHARSKDGPTPSGGTSTTPTAISTGGTTSGVPPGPSDPPLGITFGAALSGLTRPAIDAALDDVVELHLTWIRVDMSWDSLRPKHDDPYNWAPMDRIIASATAHHLTVLGLITYTPPWAREDGCDSFTCPPKDPNAFAAFAADTVARYTPRGVTSYQVWNEPNIGLFWRGPDPSAYGVLLTATVTAMRDAAAHIRILFGGLAFTTDATQDIAPATFLRNACRGRTCDVDAVGYDPFTYPHLPSSTDAPLNAWQLMSNPDAGSLGIRAAATDVGLGKAKIWVTEFGAPTNYPGSAGTRTVTETQQAAIVVDGLRLARAETGYVGAYFVDTWRDLGLTGPLRSHFGLVRHDGTHKAAFAALAKAVADD